MLAIESIPQGLRAGSVRCPQLVSGLQGPALVSHERPLRLPMSADLWRVPLQMRRCNVCTEG